MYIIVGLGNPTAEYDKTRHNVGFEAIDYIAKRYGIDISSKKHKAYYGKGIIEGQKVLLVKPQTYMNLSGESIRALIDFYKIDEKEELIVIYDDISLEPGHIRIRKKGSAGGHNGIKSIIQHLGHDVFRRIKVGVGEKPKGYDLANYVLGHFSKGEWELVSDSLERTHGAVKELVNGKIDAAMNTYNRKELS
jgi:peptidyl-tRNA hydrolase